MKDDSPFVWRALLVTLLACAIPAGSIGPVAQTGFAAVLYGLLACRALRGDRWPHGLPKGPLITVMVCWSGAVLWGALQAIPVPPQWIATAAPSLAALYGWTLPAEAGPAQWHALSTTPGSTIQSALLIGACGSLWWLVVSLSRTQERIYALAATIILAGVGQALYGLIQAGGTLTVPASGTFLNRNHFAAFLAMALCVGVGLALARWQQGDEARRTGGAGPRLDRWIGASPVAVACLTLLAGIVFSFSRMGLLAPLAALALVGAVWLAGTRTQGVRLVGAAVIATVLLLFAGAWPALERTAERFQTVEDAYRRAAWEGTRRLAQVSPIVGVGLGGLVDHLPRLLPAAIPDTFDHSHNDALELLAEGGVVYAGFVAVGLIVSAGTLIPRWVSRRDPLARGLGLGCLAGIGSVLLHSLVEFPLRMPANAFLLSALLGLAWRAVSVNRRTAGSQPWGRLSRAAVPALALAGAALSGLGCTAALLDRAGDEWLARAAAPDEAREQAVQQAAAAYRLADALEPWQPGHVYKLGRAHEVTAALLPPFHERAQEEWDEAAGSYRKAVAAHPANARVQMAWAWALLQTGAPAESRRALQAALALSPHDADLRFAASKWYLVQWAVLSEEDRRAARSLIEQGAGDAPGIYVDAVWALTGDPAAARAILPAALPVRQALLARLTKEGMILGRWREQAALPALRTIPPEQGIRVLAEGHLVGREELPAQAGAGIPWKGLVSGWLSAGLTATLELTLPEGEALLFLPVSGEPAGGIWPTLQVTVGGQAIPVPAIRRPGRQVAYVLLSSKGGTVPVLATITNGTVLREEGRFVERRARLGPLQLLGAA